MIDNIWFLYMIVLKYKTKNINDWINSNYILSGFSHTCSHQIMVNAKEFAKKYRVK